MLNKWTFSQLCAFIGIKGKMQLFLFCVCQFEREWDSSLMFCLECIFSCNRMQNTNTKRENRRGLHSTFNMEYFIGLFWQTNWSTFWSLKANVVCTSKIILRLNMKKGKKKSFGDNFIQHLYTFSFLVHVPKWLFHYEDTGKDFDFLESQGCMVHWTAKSTFFFRCHQVSQSLQSGNFLFPGCSLDMKDHSSMCLALQSPGFGVGWKGSSLTTNP